MEVQKIGKIILSKYISGTGWLLFNWKKKEKNQETEKIFQCSLVGKTKRLEAKKVELLKDLINKEILKYFYVGYTVNGSAVVSQVEHLNFWVLFQYINLAANKAFSTLIIQSGLE